MDTPGITNLVSIVVSVLAVGLFAWSLIYARQATRTAAEAELRAATPKVTGALFEEMGGGARLRILNEGPTDLDEVTVELVSGGGSRLEPSVSSLGRDPGTDHGPSVDLGPIRVGETRNVRLWRSAPLRGELRCRCHCQAGKRAWVILITGDLSIFEQRR